MTEFFRNRTEPSAIEHIAAAGVAAAQAEIADIIVGVAKAVDVGRAIRVRRIGADQGVSQGMKEQPDAPILTELVIRVAHGVRRRNLLDTLLEPVVEGGTPRGHIQQRRALARTGGSVVPITTASCGRSRVAVFEPVIHSPKAIVFEVPSVTDWMPIAGPKPGTCRWGQPSRPSSRRRAVAKLIH